MTADVDWMSATWNPSVVKTPVPIMAAITNAVAVVRPSDPESGRGAVML